MVGGNQSNDPAPWEAPGKRHTQMHGAGMPPQPPAAQMPPQQRPVGPVPARPLPQTPRPGYPPAPAYPVPAQGAYPPPPQGVYPPPTQGAYPATPQAAYPQPPLQPGVYAQQAAYYPQAKPTSGLAIGSLVCAGLSVVTGVSVLAGIVLGVLALKETGPSGDKSGRGLAIAGIALNSGLLALAALFIAIFVAGMVAFSSQMEDEVNISMDGALIAQRAEMYYRDKGDLASGGHRFVGGFKNAEKTRGPLMVGDLVGPNEVQMPLDRYFLEVKADSATVWYTGDDGSRRMAGSFSAVWQQKSKSPDDFDWPD